MFARLRESAERYQAIQIALEDPAVHAQPARLSKLLREMGALRADVEAYQRWEALQARQAQAQAMLGDRDENVVEMAREELAEVTAAQAELDEELRLRLVDNDPHRGQNVILEIRAGTGGDEAGLFVADLARLYTRFADQQGCRVETLASSPTEVGGYKDLVLCVSGPQAWDLLRYEAGGHRVQRVPETETQGRIHTSAATVAVLAEAEEQDVEIRDGDLRIDTYRAGGPGGQNVNKTSSAVRITHLPTNTVVQCQDESSQHKNKAKAMRMLRTRIQDQLDRQRKASEDAARRGQIGSGDRSERIRTYNCPQNRVTDHRIKTSYSLENIVLGHLETLVEDLRRHDLQQKLAALSEGAP
ncbi:MAG: peptide chain release factor 1 [Planctomycetota bacterium]